VVHGAAGCGPFGERAAAAELDVVGVGGDGEGDGGRREVDREGAAAAD
jgi:hypothetical protein